MSEPTRALQFAQWRNAVNEAFYHALRAEDPRIRQLAADIVFHAAHGIPEEDPAVVEIIALQMVEQFALAYQGAVLATSIHLSRYVQDALFPAPDEDTDTPPMTAPAGSTYDN